MAEGKRSREIEETAPLYRSVTHSSPPLAPLPVLYRSVTHCPLQLAPLPAPLYRSAKYPRQKTHLRLYLDLCFPHSTRRIFNRLPSASWGWSASGPKHLRASRICWFIPHWRAGARTASVHLSQRTQLASGGCATPRQTHAWSASLKEWCLCSSCHGS